MLSEPRGSPAAPGRGGRSWWPKSRSAVSLTAASAGAILAAALGVSPILVLSGTIACLVLSAVLLHRERCANVRLRAAKRALAVSELLHRQFYERLAVGALTIGADGRLRTANPACLTLLGFASERELAVVDIGEHVYSAPGTYESLLRRVRQEGELPSIELSLRRRDGLPVTVAATLRAHWDDAGAIDHYEVAVLDIGDLKFVERQKRSLERRFRRLFEANAVGILFGNLRRGTMDEANDRMRELAGLAQAELPVLLDALFADPGTPFSEAIRVALEANGHTPPLETVQLRADGSRVAALVCAATIDPLQGDFVAVVVERPAPAAETSPRADSEPLYGSVLDALPLPVARFNRALELTYCNAACRAWFGFPATPTGLSFCELLGSEDPAPLRQYAERALAGNVARADLQVFPWGGPSRAVEIVVSPHRRADAAVGGFLLTIRERGDPELRVADARLLGAADSTYNISRG